MSVANYCILAACVLPIVCAGLAKSKGFGKRRREGGYDNNNPREWLARLSGWQARANAAQANSFEALPLFIAGVLAAQQLGANQARVDMLALSFITFRLIYIGLYLADQANLRSLAWGAAFFSAGALFFV
ncbi:UNVERIFIED_ORG: MAPEG family protein [Shinella sp. XGS7]|jgi:uncharacterized MAPEG superfamily protein|nr:MAPEG family protein [Shinella sp. XGS7]